MSIPLLECECGRRVADLEGYADGLTMERSKKSHPGLCGPCRLVTSPTRSCDAGHDFVSDRAQSVQSVASVVDAVRVLRVASRRADSCPIEVSSTIEAAAGRAGGGSVVKGLFWGSGNVGKVETRVNPSIVTVFGFIATCLRPPPDGDPLSGELSTELRSSWHMSFFSNKGD